MTGRGNTAAETYAAATSEPDAEKITTSPNLAIYPNPVQTKLTVTGLLQEQYDRITVYNMQGAVVLLQTVNTNLAFMDVSSLTDGVYMLVLRSSATLKEKSMKFIVRK